MARLLAAAVQIARTRTAQQVAAVSRVAGSVPAIFAAIARLRPSMIEPSGINVIGW
jgi:hypothetical protein